jgi:hypothetical protein
VNRRPFRFWFEATLAATSAALLLLTLFRKDWIEGVVGFEPDGGNGSLEWGIAIVLGAIAVVSTVAAVTDWRRARPAEG